MPQTPNFVAPFFEDRNHDHVLDGSEIIAALKKEGKPGSALTPDEPVRGALAAMHLGETDLHAIATAVNEARLNPAAHFDAKKDYARVATLLNDFITSNIETSKAAADHNPNLRDTLAHSLIEQAQQENDSAADLAISQANCNHMIDLAQSFHASFDSVNITAKDVPGILAYFEDPILLLPTPPLANNPHISKKFRLVP
jgi:hypothetical protein